ADVIRDYCLKFTGVYALLLCLETFPDPGDNRVVVHYGGYVSPETVNIFYDEASNLHLMSRRLVGQVDIESFIRPLIHARRKCIDRLCRLRIREIEMAALAGVLLWENLERMRLITPKGAQLRNQMYTAFHNDVVAYYGSANGVVRVVRILGLVEDLT
ncbi:hypothetical protein AAVH_41010, partial [Aphelenchoides avenae]